jgi:hypothetical protein
LPLERCEWLCSRMLFADVLTVRSACIASIVRLIYSIRLTQTEDITWAIAPVGMWASVFEQAKMSSSNTYNRLAEFATVILVGCFPVLPRCWKHFRGIDEAGRSDDSTRNGKKIRVPQILTVELSHKTSHHHNKPTTRALGSYIELNERGGDREMSTSLGADVVSYPQFPASLRTVLRPTDIELVCGDQTLNN